MENKFDSERLLKKPTFSLLVIMQHLFLQSKVDKSSFPLSVSSTKAVDDGALRSDSSRENKALTSSISFLRLCSSWTSDSSSSVIARHASSASIPSGSVTYSDIGGSDLKMHLCICLLLQGINIYSHSHEQPNCSKFLLPSRQQFILVSCLFFCFSCETSSLNVACAERTLFFFLNGFRFVNYETLRLSVLLALLINLGHVYAFKHFEKFHL